MLKGFQQIEEGVGILIKSQEVKVACSFSVVQKRVLFADVQWGGTEEGVI